MNDNLIEPSMHSSTDDLSMRWVYFTLALLGAAVVLTLSRGMAPV